MDSVLYKLLCDHVQDVAASLACFYLKKVNIAC